MKHVIQHPLDAATAKKAVSRAFDAYSAKYAAYEPRLTWKGDTNDAIVGMSAKGVKLDGAIHLREGVIEIDLDVPFLLRVFQRKAIEVIDREVRMWIEKAQAGAL
ncbi:MAG TPA: polyhydroxyalkanoic acid system family protein [Byssovorax sp.]|jgi:hypothetical protein